MSRTSFIANLLILLVTAATCSAEDSSLTPWSSNPWYWSRGGEPILLLGGSDDDNLFQWPDDRLSEQLDRLAKAGGNVIRNTMSDRKDRGFEAYPFRRLEDGRYDLDQWNPEYWRRFERLLRETSRRDIFVQIEIWDRFDYTDKRNSNHWKIHPYNPANNVNYTYEQSGFAPIYPDHPGKNKQPFFFTTPGQRNNQVVLPYQQRFVTKLMDISLQFDNVLYCIDNETSGEEEWSRYWARFIRDRAADADKAINVTEMWDAWDLASPPHRRTFDHPDLYNYVDVSQNNHNRGDNHWQNFLSVRNALSAAPRPMNTTKTYGATGNKFGHTDQDGIERFWRHLLGGAASLRFHRPDSGLGLSDQAVASIRAARELELLVPLWTIDADNSVLADRDPNEAFAAKGDGVRVVYFPTGGEVDLQFDDGGGRLKLTWISIAKGEVDASEVIEAGRSLKLSPPDDEGWILVASFTA